MPIPRGVPIVDLVLTANVSTFNQSLDAVLDEACVEDYISAEEISNTTRRFTSTRKNFLPDLKAEFMPHDELKKKNFRRTSYFNRNKN